LIFRLTAGAHLNLTMASALVTKQTGKEYPMPIDPQRMAAILQRIQPANQGGAPMPAPGGAQMGGPPMPPPDMAPMGAPQGVPMQINGTMTPQPMGGPPPGMAPRPMMPPGGMPPR
jgi:hypothetical protein